jgi:alkylhydroperoxidase/carboxymuconolactone decarboxylase family protein YurZ
MSKLPEHFQGFTKNHPDVAKAYAALGNACAEGPLDGKTRALVKLGMAIGAGLEGATHSQTRKAIEAGATPEEIRHAVLQGTTTLGFPRMMAGLAWVDDVLNKSS